jgi:hypothetical protein
LARYLALRRALGFAMRAEERLLRDFVAFIDTHGFGDPLAATVAVDWAQTTAAHCGPAGQARRLSVARGFLAHVRAAVPETAVPAHGLLARARRRRPTRRSRRCSKRPARSGPATPYARTPSRR